MTSFPFRECRSRPCADAALPSFDRMAWLPRRYSAKSTTTSKPALRSSARAGEDVSVGAAVAQEPKSVSEAWAVVTALCHSPKTSSCGSGDRGVCASAEVGAGVAHASKASEGAADIAEECHSPKGSADESCGRSALDVPCAAAAACHSWKGSSPEPALVVDRSSRPGPGQAELPAVVGVPVVDM